MNSNELKKILKPLIKSCIKEIILEEKGILAHIIHESISSMKKELLQETKNNIPINEPIQSKSIPSQFIFSNQQERMEEMKQTAQQSQKMLMEAMEKTGNPNLKNIFSGLEPAPEPPLPGNKNIPSSPLAGITDAGVDISGLFNFKGKR